jgi:hypothetical protein
MDEFTQKLSRQIVLTHIPTNQSVRVTGQFLLLQALLEFETSACVASQNLAMFYSKEWAGFYKGSEVVKNASDEMVPILSRFFALDGNIPILQREFQECKSEYFYIPMILLPVVTSSQAHSNGILVHRSNGTVYRIEPAQDVEELSNRDIVDIENKIDQGILTALREIGVSDPKFYEFNVTCPQAIAKDKNCIFWTAYILREILKQISSKEPREVIRNLTTNPPDITSFKQELETTLLPAFLEKNQVKWNIQGGMYWPQKYYRGLTRKQNLQRKRSASRRTKMSVKDPKAYVPFKSDKGVKTRRSSYTSRFHKKYPDVKTLPEIAKATGISKGILQEVYDRGMAAWRTGHRPGASQQAWGMARVHSFVLKGKTWKTADSDLARKV